MELASPLAFLFCIHLRRRPGHRPRGAFTTTPAQDFYMFPTSVAHASAPFSFFFDGHDFIATPDRLDLFGELFYSPDGKAPPEPLAVRFLAAPIYEDDTACDIAALVQVGSEPIAFLLPSFAALATLADRLAPLLNLTQRTPPRAPRLRDRMRL
jgi:hypothetical protein